MANAKWYVLCDKDQNVAVDLLQIPEVWREITGMQSLNDEQLAAIGQLSEGNEEMTFLSIDTARSQGFNVDSIDLMISTRAPIIRDWIRSMRDPILALTDAFILADRWAKYDVVAQKDITQFRDALRDITKQNIFNIVWPAIPPELDVLRKFDYETLKLPSDTFIAMLVDPAPPKSIEQIKADQWLRIHDERENRMSGGVKLVVDGKGYWFWTDEKSRNQYSLLADRVRRANYPGDTVLTQWKTMSGEFVPFTVDMLHQVIDTGISNESQLFVIAETHRQTMLVSEDPASYDFRSGWPETYRQPATDTVTTVVD
jgi:hypothetical protein